MYGSSLAFRRFRHPLIRAFRLSPEADHDPTRSHRPQAQRHWMRPDKQRRQQAVAVMKGHARQTSRGVDYRGGGKIGQAEQYARVSNPVRWQRQPGQFQPPATDDASLCPVVRHELRLTAGHRKALATG